MIKEVATAFVGLYNSTPGGDALRSCLPGGLYFSQAPENTEGTYGVFSWESSEIDEVMGSADDRIETVSVVVSLFSKETDGGDAVFNAADAFMSLYDWATLTYTDLGHVACRRVRASNVGLEDEYWQVDLNYELTFTGD